MLSWTEKDHQRDCKLIRENNLYDMLHFDWLTVYDDDAEFPLLEFDAPPITWTAPSSPKLVPPSASGEAPKSSSGAAIEVQSLEDCTGKHDTEEKDKETEAEDKPYALHTTPDGRAMVVATRALPKGTRILADHP